MSRSERALGKGYIVIYLHISEVLLAVNIAGTLVSWQNNNAVTTIQHIEIHIHKQSYALKMIESNLIKPSSAKLMDTNVDNRVLDRTVRE